MGYTWFKNPGIWSVESIFNHVQLKIFKLGFTFLESLSTCQKSILFIIFFLRYSWFKKPVIGFPNSILTDNSRRRIFPEKLATEVTFTINKNFYKQIGGCTMSRPLSVTLSGTYMKNGKWYSCISKSGIRFSIVDLLMIFTIGKKRIQRINVIIHLIIIIRTLN